MKAENNKYISLPQLAKLLGVSRIAIYKKVKNGQIKAVKIGRNYAVSKNEITNILGTVLKDEDKKEIETAVKKTVAQYGETLKLLGKE